MLLRLPLEIKELFHSWLADQYPDRAERVISILRCMRGGKDYDARWFERQKGTGPYAELIAQRFRLALRRLALNERKYRLRTDLFTRPVIRGGQLALF